MNMSKTDKSGKAKTKKHLRTKTKNKVIVTIVVSVMVLLVVGYFCYTTGQFAKWFSGAKIVKNTDGKEKTVERVSITEMNYYFQKASSQLSQYGLISDTSTLDDVYNPTTGQTYREMLWETAANNAQTQYVLYDAATKSGLKKDAADRYADSQIDSLRQNVEYYNQIMGTALTPDQYLQNMYGPGMSVRVFREIVEREAYASEYQANMRQTAFNPEESAVQAKFDEKKDDYTFCQFQNYYVKADIKDGATEEEKQAALDEALNTAKKISDGCVNAVEFQTRVKLVCDQEYLDRFTKGEDPTTMKGYNKTQMKNMSEEFAELCFNPETKENTPMAFLDSEKKGAYATLFEKTYLDDEKQGSYRVLMLTDDVLQDLSNTLEVKAPNHQKWHAEAEKYMASVTDENKFIELVKEHSTDMETILAGGYTSGVKQSDFRRVETEDDPEGELTPEKQALVDWLFDPARKKGDMVIIDCVSSVNLYYFCGCDTNWKENVRTDLIADEYTKWYNELTSDSSYSTIVNHGLIDFFS